MFDRLPIRTQLIVLVLLVLLPVSGLVALSLHDRLQASRLAASQQLLAVATDMARRLEAGLQRRADVLAALARRPQVRALDAQHCDGVFDQIRALQPDVLTLELRGPDGRLLCAAAPGGLPADAARAQPWFSAGLSAAGFTVGGPLAGLPSGVWAVTLTQPVRNAAGQVGGLLVLAIDLTQEQQQTMAALGADTVVTVLDRDLRHLMRSQDGARWLGQPLPAPQRAQWPARTGQAFELTGADGVARWHVGAHAPAGGWQVDAARPMSQVDAGYRALLWRSLAGLAVALAIAGLLVWRIGTRIVRPIGALAAGAAAVASGHSGPLPAAGGREVAAVAADLRRLADQRDLLLGQHTRLLASHAQLANAARDIVLLVDADDRIVEANGAALATYGYSASELRAMTVSALRAPQARAQVDRDRAAASRAEGALYETEHQRRDGSTLAVEVSVRRLLVDGRVYYQSFIRDISARKRGEALLLGQRAVLAQIAQGAPPAESLDALARLVEAQAPDMVATILLLDDDGLHLRHGAAPSMPKAFVTAVDGAAIGPRAGSCGTAAWRREPVISEDIAADPLWSDWSALALAHGLRACWSTPIIDAAGQALGTFAMYFRQPGRPDAGRQRLVDLVTHTAAIAIAGGKSARTQRAQLDELLRWQALMVDREQRMISLKTEVDALCGRLGEAPRYRGGDPA